MAPWREEKIKNLYMTYEWTPCKQTQKGVSEKLWMLHIVINVSTLLCLIIKEDTNESYFISAFQK